MLHLRGASKAEPQTVIDAQYSVTDLICESETVALLR